MAIRAVQVSEFRTIVLSLPDGAPEVPLPYGAGHLVPSHIRIKLTRQQNAAKCTGQARVFGKFRDPGGDLTDRLEDADFPGGVHWTPEWITEIIHSACPIGWTIA
ncbi:hypothetical protein ACWD7T_34055 [Streptomyces sp. 900116325]